MNQNQNQNQDKTIAMVLAPYMTVFPTCKLDKAGLMIYARALSGYQPKVVDAAMVKLLKTSKWFPTVAEIIEAIESMTNHARREEGHGELTSAEAWAEVMKNARVYHIYSPWRFSSPAVEQAAKQFGIAELCCLEVDAVNTARAQFMRIYDGVIRSQHERQNNTAVLKMLGGDKKLLLGGAV